MKRFKPNPLLAVLSFVTMLGVVFVGVYPQPLFKAADYATETLFIRGADTREAHSIGPVSPSGNGPATSPLPAAAAQPR
jgi:hypothetical protein